MPSLSKWVKVNMKLGTLGTAVPISGITLASPAVVSYTGTDPTDGNYLAMTSIQGMDAIADRIFRADNTNGAGDTTELEGVDSTAFDAFVSGNFQPITFGNTLQTIIDPGAGGGVFDFIDTSVVHKGIKTQIPNMADPVIFNMRSQWDPGDAALAALAAASEAQTLRALLLTFGNGYKTLALGYVGATLVPTGSVGTLVETPVVFTAAGLITNYTT